MQSVCCKIHIAKNCHVCWHATLLMRNNRQLWGDQKESAFCCQTSPLLMSSIQGWPFNLWLALSYAEALLHGMLFYIGMYRVRSSSNYTLAAKKIFKVCIERCFIWTQRLHSKMLQRNLLKYVESVWDTLHGFYLRRATVSCEWLCLQL